MIMVHENVRRIDDFKSMLKRAVYEIRIIYNQTFAGTEIRIEPADRFEDFPAKCHITPRDQIKKLSRRFKSNALFKRSYGHRLIARIVKLDTSSNAGNRGV